MSFAEQGTVRVFVAPDRFDDRDPRELPAIAARICPHADGLLEAFTAAGGDAWGEWTVAERLTPWAALGVPHARALREASRAWWGPCPDLLAAVALIATSARRRVRRPCVSVGPRRVVIVDDAAIWWIGPRAQAPARAVGGPDDRRAVFRIRRGTAVTPGTRLRGSRTLVVAPMERWGTDGQAHAWHVRYDVLCDANPVPATLEDVAVTADVPPAVCEAVVAHRFLYTVVLRPEFAKVIRGGPTRGRRNIRTRAARTAAILACGALRPALLEMLA